MDSCDGMFISSDLHLSNREMASVIATTAPVVAEKVATVYTNLPEPTKAKVATGVNLFGKGLGTISSLPFMIVTAIANFLILSFIFILTLFFRNRALFRTGDIRYANYVRDALLQGFGWALVATATIFVIDLITGGFASIAMVGVYILAGVAMLILSLIKPPFLNDINETVTGPDGNTVVVSRGSAYRYWSVSFWPLFIVGMLTALALGALTVYISNKFSKNVLDLLAMVATSTNSGTATNTTGTIAGAISQGLQGAQGLNMGALSRLLSA